MAEQDDPQASCHGFEGECSLEFDIGFDTARGIAGETLASLRNLEHLLKSPKIGPKRLASAVAEMQRTCQTSDDPVEKLALLLSHKTPSIDVSHLLEFATVRRLQFNQEVAIAAESRMGAKNRLRLESHITRIVADITALKDIIDLLYTAKHTVAIDIDVGILINAAIDRCSAKIPTQKGIARVTVAQGQENSIVVADARVITTLVAMACGVIVDQGFKSIAVSNSPVRHGETTIICKALETDSDGSVLCAFPHIIPPTLETAELAASLVHAGFSFDVLSHCAKITIKPHQVPLSRILSEFEGK
ncbi:MAG: hypothetical protein FWD57_00175 [Polyangiaceae bacterium]|nr:hypothetical protein [Polyangiaceae bacterium]